MKHSVLTRWIVAFILLAAACIMSSQAAPFHDFAAFLWFLALVLMITATTLAVIRDRRRRPSG
ncbi:hypothetical protein BI49514_02088 [Brevibacterium iodinum ATCC 49514]|uniref:MYXO-CTERM domain-containing protein n=1 Tax=Brevibacterium iodinum ATCC 49514 TaxID=1255616 RepID=A0A2H1JKD7_9MICO|nr:hypothetical protein BI49514_02088 [Brevibacterium iodinum ATCC 49514]SUW14051.1 Uncharacterised protein [Brevibacterium iodinum]